MDDILSTTLSLEKSFSGMAIGGIGRGGLLPGTADGAQTSIMVNYEGPK